MLCAIYQNAPNISLALRYKQINEVLAKADRVNVDFICFPEGFLTGYYDEEDLTKKNSFKIADETSLCKSFLSRKSSSCKAT